MPTCVTCGEAFTPRHGNANTCSAECRRKRQNAVAKMRYRENPEPAKERSRKRAASEDQAIREAQKKHNRAYRQRLSSDPRRREEESEKRHQRHQRAQARNMAVESLSAGALLSRRSSDSPKIKPCEFCGEPIVGRRFDAKTCSRKCYEKRSEALKKVKRRLAKETKT
jgi:hypothetical protein